MGSPTPCTANLWRAFCSDGDAAVSCVCCEKNVRERGVYNARKRSVLHFDEGHLHDAAAAGQNCGQTCLAAFLEAGKGRDVGWG